MESMGNMRHGSIEIVVRGALEQDSLKRLQEGHAALQNISEMATAIVQRLARATWLL